MKQRVFDYRGQQERVDAFGETFVVRSLTLSDFRQVQGKMKNDDIGGLYLIVACTYDLDGNKVFTDDDVEKLAECDINGILALGERAARLNSLTDAGKKNSTD